MSRSHHPTPETQLLASDTYLGCQFPWGSINILVGSGITSNGPAKHLSIWSYGGYKAGTPNGKDQVLAISDHCPMIARLNFPSPLLPTKENLAGLEGM